MVMEEACLFLLWAWRSQVSSIYDKWGPEHKGEFFDRWEAAGFRSRFRVRATLQTLWLREVCCML